MNMKEKKNMDRFFVYRRFQASLIVLVAFMLAAGFGFANLHSSLAQSPAPLVKQVSSDPYTNRTSQHQTQVEPDTFSVGSTVVSAFQSGRFNVGGGSSGISWATSFNAGKTWKQGTLPGLTTYDGGSYARASDAVVAYDQAHHTWLISSLVAQTVFDGVTGSTAIVVSRSSNGLNWSSPSIVAAS